MKKLLLALVLWPVWALAQVQPPSASLPTQAGQAGNYLTTNGTAASWVVPSAIQLSGIPLLFGTLVPGQVLIYNGTNIVNSGSQCANISANTTLSANSTCVNVNATSGVITITLPTAVSAQQTFSVKKTDSSVNVVQMATTSAQTIDTQAASVIQIKLQYQALTFISDNANWEIN